MDKNWAKEDSSPKFMRTSGDRSSAVWATSYVALHGGSRSPWPVDGLKFFDALQFF